jgi:hypothetical protein
MAQHYRRAALVFAAFLVTACATGPEYQPRTPGSPVGYTDVQLSPDRYRVTFSGSFASNRDDVEMYLLRRAAEVTLQNGYTHFVVEKRETQRITDDLSNPYLYGRLYYPYWGNGWYAMVYSSYAEIHLLKEEDAGSPANAVDAQRVLLSLNAFQPSVAFKAAAAPQ